MGNRNLRLAQKNKRDEFYTKMSDIEEELINYSDYGEHFEGKVVYLNCDNPSFSNFWTYFYERFNTLGLKLLISTFYEDNDISYKTTYDGINVNKTKLKGNGDFRSPECIDILIESDIVVTNPPFSLFREYLDLDRKSTRLNSSH